MKDNGLRVASGVTAGIAPAVSDRGFRGLFFFAILRRELEIRETASIAMSIWNKVLVGFILVASLGLFVLAARALKTHQYWRKAAKTIEASLATEQASQVVLLDGDQNTMGVREAKLQMYSLMVDRGRVWRHCTPRQVQAGNQPVSLSLTTDQPDPNGISPKANLFIFEEKDVQDGGRYLGQFTVTAVAGKNIQLVPSMALDAKELQRLQKSKGPWSLYEIMPVDQHQLLAELSEDEIKAMFPKDTVEEYLADCRALAAEANNPDAPKPSRQLRDYEAIFNTEHMLRSQWTDEMASTKRDVGFLQSALADARRQVQFRQDEIAKLKNDSAEETKQRDEVAVHRTALEASLKAVQSSIAELLKKNQSLVGQIARIQLEATRQIDERTRRMAQSFPAP